MRGRLAGRHPRVCKEERMTAFLVAECRRAVDEADEELRRFTFGDGISPDN